MITLGVYSPKDGNYTQVIPKEKKYTKSEEQTERSLKALKDFHDFKLIKDEEYKELRKRIKNAKSDDEVSVIMCNVRKKMYK